MKKKLTNPMDIIENEIKKTIKKVIKNTTKELTAQTQIAYDFVINTFYEDKVFFSGRNSDYGLIKTNVPRSYNRTLETYKGSNLYKLTHGANSINWDNYIKLATNDESIYSYIGGIEVSDENIPGNPYRADKDWVLERTFSKGIHGISRNDERDFIKKRNKERKAKNITSKIKREDYFWWKKMFKFDDNAHYYTYGDGTNNVRVALYPNITYPYPQKLLDIKFKKHIMKNSNINKIFNDNLTSLLSD